MVVEEQTKEIFLTLKLDYVFYTEEKVDEMIKFINEFAKEHSKGCQMKVYTQRIQPIYKSSK